MKPEMLSMIFLALAVVCAITAWISARRFVQRKVPDERRRMSGVIWGGTMAFVFAFGALWMWLDFA
jgi:hypothetical protein